MDYEQRIRHPGDNISSGAELLKSLGYTDFQNPIYSFDLMNDSNFKRLEEYIKNKTEIPEQYNANIIRLRDYHLGEMINEFRDLCYASINDYETSWIEYREEYNPEMPSEIYMFWVFCDDLLLNSILPMYINLIDPLSMEWIDPEYPKVTIENGVYQYKLDGPIKTSDPTFLSPDSKMEYFFYQPTCDSIVAIYEELIESVRIFLPESIRQVDYLLNELQNTQPQKNETQQDFIRRTKWEVRYHFRRRR